MSISSEITRLQNAKNDLKTSINSKLIDNKITNETIDDYADKVDEIVVPKADVKSGFVKKLYNTPDEYIEEITAKKGEPVSGCFTSLLENNYGDTYENGGEYYGWKLNKDHFLTWYYDEENDLTKLKIKKYKGFGNELETVAEKTLDYDEWYIFDYYKQDYKNLNDIDRDNMIYYDGTYYYIPCFIEYAAVIVTDLENIYLIYDENIEIPNVSVGWNKSEVVQIDSNKFIATIPKYVKNGSVYTHSLDASLLTINYNGENTTFSATNYETLITGETNSQYYYLYIKPITKNRFVVYSSSSIYVNGNYKAELNIKLYSVSNNSNFSLIDSLSKEKIVSSQNYYWVSFEVNKLFYKRDDDMGCYQISDSGFTSIPLDPMYNFSEKAVCIYNFGYNEVMMGKHDDSDYVYKYKVYSLDGYNITEIQTNIPNRILLSPITYHQLLQPTDDGYIILSVIGDVTILKSNYDQIYDVTGLSIDYNPSTWYSYCYGLSANDGEINDYIKFYIFVDDGYGYFET